LRRFNWIKRRRWVVNQLVEVGAVHRLQHVFLDASRLD
jgi:hypothetical protein